MVACRPPGLPESGWFLRKGCIVLRREAMAGTHLVAECAAPFRPTSSDPDCVCRDPHVGLRSWSYSLCGFLVRHHFSLIELRYARNDFDRLVSRANASSFALTLPSLRTVTTAITTRPALSRATDYTALSIPPPFHPGAMGIAAREITPLGPRPTVLGEAEHRRRCGAPIRDRAAGRLALRLHR